MGNLHHPTGPSVPVVEGNEIRMANSLGQTESVHQEQTQPNTYQGRSKRSNAVIPICHSRRKEQPHCNVLSEFFQLFHPKPRKRYDLLAPVYDWFTEGFDTADLKEGKSLLDDLS